MTVTVSNVAEATAECVEGTSDINSDTMSSRVDAQSYLEDTVMGVLTEGLEDVCRVRPPNPIDYLALYLLRRSSSRNVVEVPFDDVVPVARSHET